MKINVVYGVNALDENTFDVMINREDFKTIPDNVFSALSILSKWGGVTIANPKSIGFEYAFDPEAIFTTLGFIRNDTEVEFGNAPF